MDANMLPHEAVRIGTSSVDEDFLQAHWSSRLGSNEHPEALQEAEVDGGRLTAGGPTCMSKRKQLGAMGDQERG